MPQTSPHPSAGSKTDEDSQFREQFGAVLSQLKVGNIASLAVSVRQKINMGARDSTEQVRPSRPTDVPIIGCTVNPDPLCGSFNLAYRVLFDDGVEWILKVPANGSHARFDQLAADSMTSEAFTMKMIKRATTIPVPTVHGFDASLDNDIGCPYILMDFLKGRPLYEGWYNPKASSVKREQFRVRALQTITAAMVQLNVFATHRGGALRFNSAGEAVDIDGAKVLDVNVWQDGRDEETVRDGDIWCQNVSTEDPASYFLFTLNRLGNKKGDDAYSRGVRESARLFTRWALELSYNAYPSEGKFVLVHPDFDTQNILVHDDGTLSGILDWDGVAAVPVSVGCLKYPAWLTRLPQENDRDELRYYRAMYAQYVEALVPCDQASGTTGKMGADITRMSLITGPLEVAVNYPEDTDQTVKHFYREIDRLVGEIDVADLSDSEFPGSDIGPGVGSDQSVSEELNTDAPLSGTEVEATDSGEETERTEVTEASSGSLDHSNGTSPEPLCQETLHTSSPEALDGWKDGKDFSAPGMTPREAPRIEKGDELELSSFVHDLANEAAQDQSAATAQNYEAEFTAPDLVEEGCKEVAEVLCPKATTKVGPSRKVRMLRWVMGLDEKGCKEASKAFHKQDGASHQQIKLGTEPASEQYSSLAYSRTGKVAIRLCDQAEILLRNLIARVHRDSEDSEESTSMETKTESGQDSLKSVINMLGNLIGMLPGNGVAQVETPAPARERLPQETVPFDTAHCQKCSSSDANPGPETTDQKQWFAGIDSEHVWACIAADVDKAGISISMIKEHRDAITQCVIQKLGRDIGREKQGELHLKKEAVQKAKKAPKQTKVTNTDPLCNPVPIQHPCLDDSRPTKPASPRTHLAETDGAPLRVPEERVVDIVDGKADITHPLVTASLPGVKGVLGQEIEIPVLGKPVPEGTVCLRVPPVAPGGPNMDVFHPDQYNIDFRSSESESLLSKLEAAKQRFDTEMAMREQKCKYIRLAPVHDGAEASQLGDARQKTSEHDFSTLEAIEEGNQKLRMILESFAKSYEASSGLTQTSPHAVEDDGATTMQLEFPESKNSKRGARPSEAVHLANQKLRTNLSSLQTPLVFNANVQSNICRIAEGDDEELESVAAQCQKPVRGGRWFETPRGSLKRIKDEDTVNFSVNGQETVAKTSSPSSSNDDRILAVTSVVSDEHQEGGMAQVSDFQLLFPNPIQSETVNHFQVPDTDEDADSDEEDCDAENIAQNNNGDEDDELEEGELREGGVRLDGMGQGDVQVETANRVSADREASQNSELEKTVDHGNFNMEEVCVALGNGNLDQQRMRRLKAGFKMMMAEALGRM